MSQAEKQNNSVIFHKHRYQAKNAESTQKKAAARLPATAQGGGEIKKVCYILDDRH